jgi:hypothetical protein
VVSQWPRYPDRPLMRAPGLVRVAHGHHVNRQASTDDS